ncbi:Hypothetical predicted protein [Olea europaea subsp. europaea]|uniref:Uncharacterized protein n=1 Tax=Olea europaea subsp. europaea TaxID=158383 RepID=A0A8S0TFX4_OLEEU|nr:Hypothetical predicted protein [Olea europaea subsp. europaea]
MKEQLTKAKSGRLKNFGYGSILVTFVLEKIPLMQTQYIALSLPPPTEPHMQRWVDHMSRHADVGPVRPVARPRVPDVVPTGEAAGRAILRDLNEAETISALQDQIEGLTLGIPDVRIDELPLMLQRHTTGVPRRWTRLLRMIAQAVTCYHEHH